MEIELRLTILALYTMKEPPCKQVPNDPSHPHRRRSLGREPQVDKRKFEFIPAATFNAFYLCD